MRYIAGTETPSTVVFITDEGQHVGLQEMGLWFAAIIHQHHPDSQDLLDFWQCLKIMQKVRLYADDEIKHAISESET
jgi:hypothetical protein